MLNLKQIIIEVEDLFNMKALVSTYEEIASMKMQKLRGNVMTSRTFISELAEIYQEIAATYKEQIIELLKQRKKVNKNSLSVRKGNGKTACVFLSANSGLFGQILRKTYKEFADYTTKHSAEPVILGKFGKTLFEEQFPGRQFIYFPLGEAASMRDLFKNILEGLLVYENVVIFYSRFESMASQYVAMLDFSGEQNAGAENSNVTVQYLFEPSLETVLDFFEKQIFSSILDQTFTESDLARYAARMVILDSAMENIDNKLKGVDLKRRIAVHKVINKKQVETLTSMSLWKI